MISNELFNVMNAFVEPSIYHEFSTCKEIEQVLNQLTLGQLATNRDKYVASCLLNSVIELLETSLRKSDDLKVNGELEKLKSEVEYYLMTLTLSESIPH